MKPLPPVIIHDTASWCHTCNPGLKTHPIERMIELLKQKTEEKSVIWEKDNDNREALNLHLDKVIIQIVTHSISRPKAGLFILTTNWDIIDFYQNEQLEDLYALARRQVMSADDIINGIIKQLEKTSECPDFPELGLHKP
jgi:hypothetical protein